MENLGEKQTNKETRKIRFFKTKLTHLMNVFKNKTFKILYVFYYAGNKSIFINIK